MKHYNCIYNAETSTLRIEKPLSEMLPSDTIVMQSDIMSLKVFIKFVCRRYPDKGTNSTHLNADEVLNLCEDIQAYEQTYDEIISDMTIEDMDNEEWRV